MEGHAQKNASSDTVNWQTRKWSNFIKFKSLPGWSSINQISWRIVRSLLTNCREMLVLCTNWTTWHSVIGQQTCKISHKIDSGMWQTISNIAFFHSSHKPFPTVLSREQHGTALSIGLTQTLLATLRIRNQPRWESCVSLEVEPWLQSVGCARSKLLSRAVLQSLRLFLWMLDYLWMGYLLLIFGT